MKPGKAGAGSSHLSDAGWSLTGAIVAPLGIAWLRGRAAGKAAWESKRQAARDRAIRQSGEKLDQVKRLKELELENARLRKAVSDLTLDKLILKEAARGNY